MEDFPDEDGEMPEPSEVMAEFISQFLSGEGADQMYRKHYCDLTAHRIYNEFGLDGMCELMMSMDKKASWMSDIIFEASDLENIMYKKYGTFDSRISEKARMTKAMSEFNEKLWRLRRKYAKLIVDEIMEEDVTNDTQI